MGKMISPEVLRRFSFFAGFDAATIKEFSMASTEVEVKKGEWLFRDGDKADGFYIILKGKIDIKVSLGEKGICQVAVSSLTKGDILGWSSLVDPYVYKLCAFASQDSRLIKMDCIRLCEMMAHQPHIGYMLMTRIAQVIGNRLVDLRVRFISLVEGERWQRLAVPRSLYVEEGGRLGPPKMNK
jgi:CRP/FNR family cyclic AMP-dependent transcriptional regulator